MLLERIFDENLAQAGYLIACQRAHVALVVDPNRDSDLYLEAAARHNVRITHVTETHIHADFVSGARALAERTGATLYLSDAGPAEWKYRYASSAGADLLTHGSQFMVGDVGVEAVHTPGHTPEHITFLVTDSASAPSPMGALTGDFIFVGDVGRPDLLERAAGQTGTMDAAARDLFRSIQTFKQHPDYLQIWPGHGAGSACGKALGAMPQSTLGYEKLFNWALVEADEESFVREVLEGQPEPPEYFARMKQLNRDGPPTDTAPTPRQVEASAIADALHGAATVLDTRTAAEFATKHAKGSVNIPRNKSFLNWAGSLLPYDNQIWVIGASDENARRLLAKDLSLIGMESIAGVFAAEQVGELADTGIDMTSTPQVAVRDVNSRRGAAVLDVRARSEYASGHLPGALNIPLAELQARLGDIPAGRVIVHCQGGGRSSIATSILLREGRDNVANMTGGFSEWERSGNPVERGDGPTPG